MPALDNAYALVIGIAHYQYLNPLSPTVLKDAQDIAALLTDPQHCGYLSDHDHMQVLLDEQATGPAIRQALAALAQRSNQESTVFIYVSSHGGRVDAGPHAGEYLLPVDTVWTSPQALAGTAISGTEFSEALRVIPARKVVVVFDCCHAGGIGLPKEATAPLLKAGVPISSYQALQAGHGRALLASSLSTEESYVLPGAKNSLFTQHLLAGLRGGIASDDGLIRIFDLFEYLQPKVTAEQPNQHPYFIAQVQENFPVALYLGGTKGVVPTVADGFRFDAYVSFVDQGTDRTYVRETLVPRLKAAGVRVALSEDVEEPGVDRVVNVERGISQAKRTVIALSDAYLADHWEDFLNVMVQTMGIEAGTYPLVPVKIAPISGGLPVRLSMLASVDLTDPGRSESNLDRLARALKGPVPKRSP